MGNVIGKREGSPFRRGISAKNCRQRLRSFVELLNGELCVGKCEWMSGRRSVVYRKLTCYIASSINRR